MRKRHKNTRNLQKIVSLTGIIIFGTATVVFAALFFQSILEVKQAESTYAELGIGIKQGAYEDNIDKNASGEISASDTDAESNLKKTPSIDFAALQDINADAAIWLIQEGSSIDYPVVKGKDNEYYLSHLIDGQSNRLGTLFLDYRNSADLSDKCSIIYGHNIKNGVMFGSLTEYVNQDYYEKHPDMTVCTPEGEYTLELFAGVVVSGDYQFIRFDFQDDADFIGYVNELKEKSTFISNTAVQAEDRIIALCTCSYQFNNARFALFGRIVKK